MQTKEAVVVNNYYIKKDDTICVELYNEAWGNFVIPYNIWSQNYSNSSDLHPAKLVIGTKVLVRGCDPKSTGICEYDVTKRLTPVSASKRKLKHDLDDPYYITVQQIDKYACNLLKKMERLKKKYSNQKSR